MAAKSIDGFLSMSWNVTLMTAPIPLKEKQTPWKGKQWCMAQIFSVVRVAMEALRDLCGSEVKASDSGAEGPEFVSRLWKGNIFYHIGFSATAWEKEGDTLHFLPAAKTCRPMHR